MYKLLLLLSLLGGSRAMAQVADSAIRPALADSANPVVVEKDPRIEQLVRKQIEINEVTTRESRRGMGPRSTRGSRASR